MHRLEIISLKHLSNLDPIDESLVGKEYEVVDVDYHGPKTTYDWLYHFGRYTHEEYWNGGLFKKEDTDDEEDVVEN